MPSSAIAEGIDNLGSSIFRTFFMDSVGEHDSNLLPEFYCEAHESDSIGTKVGNHVFRF